MLGMLGGTVDPPVVNLFFGGIFFKQPTIHTALLKMRRKTCHDNKVANLSIANLTERPRKTNRQIFLHIRNIQNIYLYGNICMLHAFLVLNFHHRSLMQSTILC